ncbi:MAG: peptidase M49 [Planctomycetota bacterium]
MKHPFRAAILAAACVAAACSGAPEPTAGDPSVGEPAAGEPTAGEQAAGEQAAGEPTAAEPAAAKPAAAGIDDSGATPTADGRRYLLERVDKTAIVQLYADGFQGLPLRDKLLAYHLTQAAIAGRDIYIDQRFEYNLPLRWLLESLFLVKDRLPAEVATEVDRYCRLFWVNNGIHDNLSTRKVLLRLSWEQFEAACEVARRAGHALSFTQLSPLHELKDAYAVLTDPATHVSVTDKSTENDNDPLAASSNNLYRGLTSDDLERAKRAGFVERNGLNSRLVLRDNRLFEEVFRCGNRTVPPGRYADRIAAVNEHLRAALPFAPLPTRHALQRLIRYNETGSLDDWREFNIAWVADKDSTIDFTLGFIEVYLDPRGIKGGWEGIVSFRDAEKTKEIAALAAEAPWFEARMPWDERFRKADVKGISARAINVVTETGDSGPITPVGINLPNEADVRQQYGSKSVNLANVVDAYNHTTGAQSAHEFAWSAEEAARAERHAAAMDDLHTNLHEVVGHASGQVLAEIQNPAQRLGLFYSTLEEGRADLVGLYWIADAKLKEMGLVPDDDAVLAKYESYARNALVQLRRVPPGGRVEEDHMRNRQMIVHWLLANDGGVHVDHRDGKTFYVVESVAKFRDGCGRLLAEVMRIKAEGDFAGGKKLVETYGVRVDPALHPEVLARLARLDLPSVTGFVQPELRLVTDSSGNPTDVEVVHCQDIADQMLRWSHRR